MAGHETLSFGADIRTTLLRREANALSVSTGWDLTAFARMLAKIAYSSAVARFGSLDRSKIPVLPFIRGTADDGCHWIGSSDFTLEIDAREPQHSVGFIDYDAPRDPSHVLLVVRVKLFSTAKATGYEVVVLAQ